MSATPTTNAVSRRAALAGLSAGGLGLALAVHSTAAQESTPASFAGHPNVGVWMIDSPIGPAIAVYSADGTVITALTASQAGPQGVTFSSTQIGTWEPTGDRSTHLTVVQLLSDAEGTFTGTVTVDALQSVSDDGQTFTSEEGSSITIRDAANNVLNVISGESVTPAVGIRMGVGNPGLPEPMVATPAA